MAVVPGLFGITHSNRDFSLKDTWGKNQFNSSFPAALACYLYSKELKAVYYKTDSSMQTVIEHIGIEDLYKADPLGDDTYFAFETQFTPFQKYVLGSIPRNDLVIMNGTQSVSSLEIKLTALPDNPTCDFSEDAYGSEIVIRPDPSSISPVLLFMLATMIVMFYKAFFRMLVTLLSTGLLQVVFFRIYMISIRPSNDLFL